MALTPKQLAFCQEYLTDLNGTQAAIRAGYSPKTANEQAAQLLAKLSIQDEIARLQDARAKRNDITQDYVLTRLRENVERAMQAEPVRDADGNPTGEYRYEGSVANAALKLLGEHLGIFVKKVDVTSGGKPLPSAVAYRELPDDELDRRIAAAEGGEGAAAAGAGGRGGRATGGEGAT